MTPESLNSIRLDANTTRPTMGIRFLVAAALHLVIDASRPWMWEGESPR